MKKELVSGLKTFKVINPVNNKLIKEYPCLSGQDVTKKLEEVKKGFLINKMRSFEERGWILRRLGDILEEREEKLAKSIAIEMGKPIREGGIEIKKSVMHCRYYAEKGEEMVKDEILEIDGKRVYIRYEPMGPIFNIGPWNFPIWMPLMSQIPQLMLGNSILFKPSTYVPDSALHLEEIMRDAGFCNGEFLSVFIGHEECEQVISSDLIAGVALTGSTSAGRQVAAIAGKYLKKSVMELGGSDPFIVMEDADLHQAAKFGAISRLQNTGQVCISAKRFIIHHKIYNQFLQLLINEVQKFKIGNPLDPHCIMGPLARYDLMLKLHSQITKTIDMGARVIYGDVGQLGSVGREKGNYFSPMILENIDNNSPGWREEIFGPVLILCRAKDEEEAVKLGNDSVYGLGGAIFTQNIENGRQIAHLLNTGSVYINYMTRALSQLPFGGNKYSGYGRQCSYHAIKEFASP